MNDRITTLREQSLRAQPTVSLERAELLTTFYKSGIPERVSIPVARALAFKYLLEHKTICINPGELIVGERGPVPKATPTYPEICTHSLRDFEIINSREKIPFTVDEKTRAGQEQIIIPFWSGRSMRDRIFDSVDESWQAAYRAGVFTEFQEQRAPGHTVLGDKIYRLGLLDFKTEMQERITALDSLENVDDLNKREELKAMGIAADGLIAYAARHAEVLVALAKKELNATRKKELQQMTEITQRVPGQTPRTFWEALQYYWFVHLGVITELNTWDSFNPGRLDQHLYPFYRRDLAAGILTELTARELLQAFWIKFNNQPAPPKVGVTAQESNTYTDFCLINLGGLTADGKDASNELTFIILDVIEQMRLVQPGSMVQISKRSPDRLLQRALTIIRTGYGQPSLFNTEAIISELRRQGKSKVDARNGGASGCVESGAFGKESYILTGYFNLVKVLELTLSDGVDPRTAEQIGPADGESQKWCSYDEFFAAFKRQLQHFIEVKLNGNRVIEKLWAQYLPAPFLSLLIDDCISHGRDYHNGGARYNTAYLQGVGLGTITDSLVAIKYHVFDKRTFSFDELKTALQKDFVGFEPLRELLLEQTPRYGNDDDYADGVLQQVFDCFFELVDGRPNTNGGHYRINLLPTTCHVYFGSVVGATPDGRQSGEPLSEGISPVQGADRQGPTAVLKSAAKIDHLKTGGTLLNQKFTPDILADDEDLVKVGQLVRSYFKMNGHHIQFNVVTAETLRSAQKEPEKHRDLIVRVAGYSDYFVDLGVSLQNEIIKRTEHGVD